MELENRYLVFKLSDVGRFPPATQQALMEISAKVDLGRSVRSKDPLQGIFIEHDWPEYEPTLALLSARVDGDQKEPYDLGYTAHKDGISMYDNRFSTDQPTSHEQWLAGWIAGWIAGAVLSENAECAGCTKRKTCPDVWMSGFCLNYDEERKEPFYCSECDNRFTKGEVFRMIITNPEGVRVFRCSCPTCNTEITEDISRVNTEDGGTDF